MIGWFDTLSNWGRWGADDQLGTLNHITPERRRAALDLVEEGVVVSCAWDIGPPPGPAPDWPLGPPSATCCPPVRASRVEPRGAGAAEWIGLAFHGYAVTHLDSLAHMFWDGRMYNGRPAGAVTVHDGATHSTFGLRPRS